MNNMNITEPLQLATGSHEAGSGRGCAMNVISWENGDTKITDFPACSDQMLARIVQRLNDGICDHTESDVLCASCALVVLDLGHRTVGSGEPLGLSADERHRVWVRVAAHMARLVVHLADGPEALAAIEAAEGWADGTVTVERLESAFIAARYASVTTTPTANAAAWAAYAAHTAAKVLVATDAANAAYVATDAAYAAANAAAADAAANTAAYATYCAAANADDDATYAIYATYAYTAIDKFWELVGSEPTPVDAERINQALRDMSETRA